MTILNCTLIRLPIPLLLRVEAICRIESDLVVYFPPLLKEENKFIINKIRLFFVYHYYENILSSRCSAIRQFLFRTASSPPQSYHTGAFKCCFDPTITMLLFIDSHGTIPLSRQYNFQYNFPHTALCPPLCPLSTGKRTSQQFRKV